MHQSPTLLIKYRLAAGFFMQNYFTGFCDSRTVGLNGLSLYNQRLLCLFAFERVITSLQSFISDNFVVLP